MRYSRWRKSLTCIGDFSKRPGALRGSGISARWNRLSLSPG
jgi:hypothetical protein